MVAIGVSALLAAVVWYHIEHRWLGTVLSWLLAGVVYVSIGVMVVLASWSLVRLIR